MIKNKVTILTVSIASVVVLASALPAFAATNANTSNAATRLAAIISRSDKDISDRLTSLANLNTRVQAMKNESAAEKANISSEVQTNTNGLTSLKAKIDADTTVATAAADAKTIFNSYRIYALVIPRDYLLAASDRVVTIDSMMTTLGTKMQTRITADQNAGKNVSTLTAAMTDYNAKIADSATQSANAQAGVINLTPDNGNATVAASNKAALVASRADIKNATADLTAARADIKTILAGLKALK